MAGGDLSSVDPRKVRDDDDDTIRRDSRVESSSIHPSIHPSVGPRGVGLSRTEPRDVGTSYLCHVRRGSGRDARVDGRSKGDGRRV